MVALPRVLGVLTLLTASDCAPGPNPNNPPQTNLGACSHYQNELRQVENVPNCMLRNQTTLINGLPPAYPGNKS